MNQVNHVKNIVKSKLSRISTLHYIKLFGRSFLLLTVLTLYVLNKAFRTGKVFGGFKFDYPILITVACIYAAEMIMRFFPSRLESMGCQKQFAVNFKPDKTEGLKLAVREANKQALIIAGMWIGLNAIFVTLYFTNVIDYGIMCIISLAYSVCDMICILFFCPFQSWIMKNRCCNTCRIYNWDFAMMFTLTAFVMNPVTITLSVIAFTLFIVWEVLFALHPERFLSGYNKCLECSGCREKLCNHKIQLHSLWKSVAKKIPDIVAHIERK